MSAGQSRIKKHLKEIIMDKVLLGSRIVLGLIFTVFGLNGFFNFIPMPPPAPEMGAFMGALAASGYFFPLLKGTEVLVGLALLSGKFVPLALIVLAPISIDIFFVHAVIDPAGLPMGILVLALHLVLIKGNWESYKELFKA